jgi:hypothetical protein
MASPGKKAFALRIDPDLWAEIERLAAAELRSANAQVEYLLRQALRARLGDGAVRRAGRPPRTLPAAGAGGATDGAGDERDGYTSRP